MRGVVTRFMIGVMVLAAVDARPGRAADIEAVDIETVDVETVEVRPAPAAREEDSYLSQFGWGMAAIGTNLGYMPAKFLYAMGGGLVGLLAYGVTVGNSDAVQGILSPSIGGTWVLTPNMLRGRDPIFFVGESYEPPKS